MSPKEHSVSSKGDPIRFDAEVERLAPEVPRFIVYSGQAWDETATFIVEVSLNGIVIGLRSLIPWKERGWHFGLSQPMCDQVGIETGDRVRVEMCRPADARPNELKELLSNHPKAQKAWNALKSGEQRDFLLFVASAKKPETRVRRAMKLLGH